MNLRILALALLFGLSFGAPPHAYGAEGVTQNASSQNAMTRIASTESEIQIEVTSTRPFPVRALRPVLKIGDREFARSRRPQDGRLDTLIFLLPENAWGELVDGAPTSVFFALSLENLEGGGVRSVPERSRSVWNFGGFDKNLLDGANR